MESDLFSFLKQHKLKDALYLTGKLVKEDQLEILQRTWIRSISAISDYTNVSFMKLYDTCATLDTFIQSEQFNIKDAFLITAKICILFQNMVQYVVIPKRTISQLRTKTIAYFSDSIKLSEAGINLFESILPKAINEREFCLQIISTLVSLWSSKNHLAFRDCLEYLCRKDYTIESVHQEDGNIVAFIWEFLNIFQPEKVKAIYSIYKTDYKKKEKSWRISLLFGMHNCINNIPSWTENENHILQKTELVSKEMWNHIANPPPPPPPLPQPLPLRNEEDKLAFFESYFPKIQEHPPEYEEEVLEVEIKQIYISKKKLRL